MRELNPMLGVGVSEEGSMGGGSGSGSVSGGGGSVDASSITLLIPGLTIPLGDVPYLLIACLVSLVFHELGHALAAATEGINVTEVGCFLYICFPVAYVGLDDEGATMGTKLRVFAAGIWHNLVLCVMTVLVLSLVGALLLQDRDMDSRDGVLVLENYIGGFSREVPRGSVIRSLDACGDSVVPWAECAVRAEAEMAKGYCVREFYYQIERVKNGLRCCSRAVPKFACFTNRLDQRACLHAKSIHVTKRSRRCLHDSDCQMNDSGGSEKRGGNDVCVWLANRNWGILGFDLDVSGVSQPELLPRSSSLENETLLFIARGDLYEGLEVTDEKIRWPLNYIISFRTLLVLLRAANYVYIISFSIAVMNLFPKCNMDGEKIFEALEEGITRWSREGSSSKRKDCAHMLGYIVYLMRWISIVLFLCVLVIAFGQLITTVLIPRILS